MVITISGSAAPRPRNSKATKELLLAAAGEEFSEDGLARHIEALMASIPLKDGNLTAFAAARFDFMLANPQVSRLSSWRVLERSEPTEAERQTFEERVASVAAAQEARRIRSDLTPIDLFSIVL